MPDFFQMRIRTNVPERVIATATSTAQECPVCHRHARVLVRPPFDELQSEICVDFCKGDVRYPRSYVSFEGSYLEDGNRIVETLKGDTGVPGRNPTREELVVLIKEVLDEQGFWRRLFGRVK